MNGQARTRPGADSDPKSALGEPLGESLLRECGRAFTRQLFDVWPTMMDKVDDSLYDLADKASDSQSQAVFFDAMRHVRLKRTEMEESFRTTLSEQVANLKPGDSPDAQASLEGGLSLVQTDELEESLAVTNMVEKVEKSCREALFALERRVAATSGVTSSEDCTNPFAPRVICEAFQSACTVLELDIAIRLRVFKLFDRHVVSEAANIYATLNDLFVKHGVLPEIRSEVRKSASGGRPTQGAADAPAADGPQAGAGAPLVTPGAGPPQAGAVAGGYPGAGGSIPGVAGPGMTPGIPAAGVPVQGGAVGPAMPAYASMAPGQAPQPEHMLEALYQIMTVKGAAAVQPSAATSSSLFASLGDLQLREFVDLETAPADATAAPVTLRSVRETQALDDAEPIDQILIDVVAMMFEYILDDDSMPSEMKALISRLQIPMLKAAILDKSCFARMHHPARSLLNTLAEAALGWQSKFGKDAAFFERIEGFVREVLTDFDDDISVFATVLKSLRAFLDEEEAKAAYEAEQTARIIERRERLAHARAATREALTSHLSQDGLPLFVHDFLGGHWRELLIAHYINDESGERFADAVTLTQELVWSLLPQPQLDWRKQLLKSLSGLVDALRTQLQTFPLPSGEQQRFFDALSAYHLELIRSGKVPEQDRTDASGRADEDAPAGASVDIDLTFEPAEDADATDADTTTASTSAGDTPDPEALVAQLRQSIVDANTQVHTKAEAQPECHGMGTTVVVACYESQWLNIAHVGDSRLYRKRESRLEQLTRDHSLREDLVAKGFYTREEAVEKVPGNYVTRAVGGDAEIEVDTDRVFTLEGDLFVLCSDGLSDMLDDNDIKAIVDADEDVDLLATRLIDAANEAGGLDNVSVVVMRIPADKTAHLEIAGHTDVGRKRSNNEDCVFVAPEHGLGIVADGMGGANAGEVASAMTVAAITAAFGVDGAAPPVTAGADDNASSLTGEGDDPFADVNLAAIDALLAADDEPEEASGQPSDAGDRAKTELEALAAEYGEVEEIVLDSNVSGLNSGGVKQTIVAQSYVDEFLAQAREISIGTWVLFTKADGEQLRGRLSWKSDVSDKLLFTDRSGLKVADPTVHGFAIELRRATATIVDDVPLFDRAMSSLTQRLRGNGATAGT